MFTKLGVIMKNYLTQRLNRDDKHNVDGDRRGNNPYSEQNIKKIERNKDVQKTKHKR